MKNASNISIMSFLFGESRSGAYHPSQFPPKWVVAGANSKAGVNVSDDSARGIAAAYACIKVLSESVGSLPLVLYRRLPNGGKERATTNPLYSVLHDRPNKWMTSIEWREMMMGHLCLRGNAYCQVLRDKGNRVIELIPLNPTLVTPYLKEQQLRYKYTPISGPAREFAQEEILHVKGLSSDGLVGESPISVAREVFGMTIATQTHGSKSFANGAAIRGVLKMPGHFEDEEKINDFRKQWKEMYGSAENTAETAILEDGLEWQQVSMSMRDAQFIELFKLNIEEIARIYRVPPHKIGHLDHATFSNIEHQGLEFVTDTLLPWLRRFEQALHYAVLGNSSQFFCEFLVDGLLRGDIKSRYDAYAVGVTNGWLTRNEVRAIENMNPEEGLDEFLVPLNMGKEGDDPKQDGGKDPETPKKEEPKPSDEGDTEELKALEPIIRHECGRLVRRRLKAIEAKNFNREKERPILEQSLSPLFEAAMRMLGLDVELKEGSEILAEIERKWDDATEESQIESVRLKNYKLVLNSILGKIKSGG